MEQLSIAEYELQEQMRSKEATSWDLKFQNYWTNLAKEQSDSNEISYDLEKIIQLIGDFRNTAQSICKQIIDFIHLPP